MPYVDEAVRASLAEIVTAGPEVAMLEGQGVRFINSPQLLARALADPTIDCIVIAVPGLTINAAPANPHAKVVTDQGGMTVSGAGVLYLVGPTASATVTGGVAHAFGGATITTVTGGWVYAYGTATITTVTGGQAYAYDTATITTVTGGEARAYDTATITTVTGGEARAYDTATITTVTGGEAHAHETATITTVTGGEAHAYDTATITTVTGGEAYALDTATITTVTGGDADAYDTATITTVTGGQAYALDTATITTVTGGEARLLGTATIAHARGDALIHAKGSSMVTVDPDDTGVVVHAYDQATVTSHGGTVIRHSDTAVIIGGAAGWGESDKPARPTTPAPSPDYSDDDWQD